MVGDPVIFCLSIQHTGTWSTLAWILKHEGVNGFLAYPHIFDILEPDQESGIYPVHPMESGEMVERWDPRLVLHDHMKLDPKVPTRIDRTQVLISTVNPTVIPIRDPLASLISYQVRAEKDGRTTENGFAPRSHVDTWVALAQTWRGILFKYAHIRFMPWDLLGKGDRFEIAETLVGISQDLGLRDALPSMQCAREIIHNNDLGSYDLKRAYLKRDLGFINENVSHGAVLELMQNTDILRPFLEGLGYKKLMWW